MLDIIHLFKTVTIVAVTFQQWQFYNIDIYEKNYKIVKLLRNKYT